MSENKSRDKDCVIDVDAAIAHFNYHNNTKDGAFMPMTRVILAKNLGICTQTLSNYSTGKIPNVVKQLKDISEVTGASIDSIVNRKK